MSPCGPPWFSCRVSEAHWHSAGAASRPAALLVIPIFPKCSILAPCRPGASSPSVHNELLKRDTRFAIGSGRLDTCSCPIAEILEPGTDVGVSCHRVQEIELREDGINLARAPDGTVVEIRRGDPLYLLVAQRAIRKHPKQVRSEEHTSELQSRL